MPTTLNEGQKIVQEGQPEISHEELYGLDPFADEIPAGAESYIARLKVGKRGFLQVGVGGAAFRILTGRAESVEDKGLRIYTELMQRIATGSITYAELFVECVRHKDYITDDAMKTELKRQLGLLQTKEKEAGATEEEKTEKKDANTVSVALNSNTASEFKLNSNFAKEAGGWQPTFMQDGLLFEFNNSLDTHVLRPIHPIKIPERKTKIIVNMDGSGEMKKGTCMPLMLIFADEKGSALGSVRIDNRLTDVKIPRGAAYLSYDVGILRNTATGKYKLTSFDLKFKA